MTVYLEVFRRSVAEQEEFRVGIIGPDNRAVGDPIIRAIFNPGDGGRTGVCELPIEMAHVRFDGPGVYPRGGGPARAAPGPAVN